MPPPVVFHALAFQHKLHVARFRLIRFGLCRAFAVAFAADHIGLRQASGTPEFSCVTVSFPCRYITWVYIDCQATGRVWKSVPKTLDGIYNKVYTILMNDKTAYIYTLTDPTTEEVRYVGCTTTPLARKQVQTGRGCWTSKGLNRWVNKMLDSGRRPLFSIVDSCFYNQRYRVEYQWIAHYRDSGAPLLNVFGVSKKYPNSPTGQE